MKASKYPVVAGIALLLLGSGAMAQMGPFATACGADVKSFCADVKPGGGRIRDCIRSHVADLSAPCKDMVSKAAAIGPACKDDMKTVCAGVKPGEGRIMACMVSHMADLSGPCKDAMSAAGAGKS